MKKKLRTLISCLLMLSMVLGVFPLPDLTMEVQAKSSGVCGNHATWTLDDDGRLTISGIGEISGFNNDLDKDEVYEIVIESGITSIKTYAFRYFHNLTNIKIPDSVTTIGDHMFTSCSNLKVITIPDSVTKIESYLFYSSSVQEIYFKGTLDRWNEISNNYRPNGLHCITSYGNFDNEGKWILYDNGLLTVSANTAIENMGMMNEDRPKVTKLVIENGIQRIGDHPFSSLINLTEVVIPDSVTSLGEQAFVACSSLEHITLPESVTSIGKSAFYNCSSLKSITIPESVTSIGDNAFCGCSNLKSIKIPESVTSIGDDTFKDCSSLTDITIHDEVTLIGNYAFKNCSSLESIILPEKLVSIGMNAFADCSALDDIYYSDTREKWTSLAIDLVVHCCADSGVCGDNVKWRLYEDGLAVYRGTSYAETNANSKVPDPEAVTKAIVMEGVTSIGFGVFYNCINMTEITIPDSVTSIGAYAFENCQKLSQINISASVKSIREHALCKCYSMTEINVSPNNSKYASVDGVLFNKAKTKLISCPGGISGNYVVPDTVTDIGENAFYGCNGLKSIKLPKNVYRIAGNAFNECESLTEIIADENSPYYSTVGGVLLSKDQTRLVNFPGGIKDTYTVPESVTIIGEMAFIGCTGLKNINLSSGLRIIEANAFYNCKNLESIVFPECVKQIGESAFAYCSKLTEVTLPRELEKLEYGTFLDTALETITVQDWIREFNWSALPLSLKKINYISDIDYWKALKFYNGNSLTDDNGLGYYTFQFNYEYYIPVKTISMLDDITSISLKVGGAKWLYYQIEPMYASNKDVIWSSSNAAVATVSEYGNVKAVAEGEAVITAETVDGGKKATCTVKVTGEGATDPSTDPDPSKPGKDDPASDIDNPTPVTEEPITLSENKTEKINDVDVTVSTEITYPKAVNWTGSKISKSQLAALSKEGVIAKVKISGLEQAIAGMNKDADLSKLVTISYIIGKEKKAGAEGSFTVKLKLNSKVLKKAKIKGKDKKALENIIKELNKQFKANPYKFKILPVDISDTVNVESVTLKAKLKNGELQLNEDGSIKGLKSLKIKVKVPGLKKAKSYTFSGKKIAKSFTIKLTDAAAKKAEVTALAGQNFTGSRSGVEITK